MTIEERMTKLEADILVRNIRLAQLDAMICDITCTAKETAARVNKIYYTKGDS